MKKVLNNILLFCDKHHKEFIYLTFTLFIISGVLFIFFHTKEYGYKSDIKDNIFSSVFPLIMMFPISKLYKIDSKKLEKRTVTYFYLLVFSCSLADTGIGLYCIFVHDISIIAVMMIYLLLFAALIALLFKTRKFYKKYFEDTSSNLKSCIKMVTDMFKINK